MTATMQSDWRGVRHARITRSMLAGGALTAAQSAVLGHVCYLIPYGESGYVSNADLARRTGYTEGYVSVIMRQLAGETVTSGGRIFSGMPHPRITRTWTDSGFLIAPVPPAELARRDFLARQGDQPVDPPHHAPPSRSPRAEPAEEGDQQVDPPILIDHDHQNQQQQAPADSALLEEFAGDDPQVVQQVIARNPNLTIAEVHEQLAIATERPDVRNPRGLVLHCLADGQRVTPARRITERKRERQSAENKPWDTPEQLAQYFEAHNAAQRSAAAPDADPPDDMTDEERAWWQERIDAGFPSAEVLNGLLTWRYQAGAFPIGGAR